jgi:hypothetical protein
MRINENQLRRIIRSFINEATPAVSRPSPENYRIMADDMNKVNGLVAEFKDLVSSIDPNDPRAEEHVENILGANKHFQSLSPDLKSSVINQLLTPNVENKSSPEKMSPKGNLPSLGNVFANPEEIIKYEGRKRR